MKMPMFRIVLILKLLMISVGCLTPDEIQIRMTGWNIDPNTQYHIQTDEGPERYFKFQTLNGQFRKEKRLADGTVIGTEGWLDPLGYLRIKDYIADSGGFRILKSKTVFVGIDRPINDAMAVSRRVPASTGVAVRPRRPPNPFRTQKVPELSSNSIEGSRETKPHRSYSLSPSKTYPRYYSTTILPILVNEIPNEIPKPRRKYNPISYEMQPPYKYGYKNSNLPSRSSEPITIPIRSNKTAKQSRRPLPNYSIERYDNSETSNYPVYISENDRKRQNNYRNSPSTSEEQFPQYDGTHTVNDGFQYYLKSHYHEEEQKPDKSIGSYGYIDPFGIRRVVYYKADRENGFIHKNNNRYVGFRATPYDPVPFESN